MRISLEDKCRIQAMIDIFKRYFNFEVNGKALEIPIFQGGMGFDFSGIELAVQCAKAGCAGTISTTGVNYKKEELAKAASSTDIIGCNNLVAVTDYERNYELTKTTGLDFIASGAGINKTILRRLKLQSSLETPHFYTVPIVSSVDQLMSWILLKPGYIIIENTDSGGHNGQGLNHKDTLNLYLKNKEEINKIRGKTKLIYAGGLRTPEDILKVLNAGFDAVQLGTQFLYASETKISEEYREIMAGAKEGDVGNIVSPAGLAASGFTSKGIMKQVLNGKSFPKIKKDGAKCESECLSDCSRIDISKEKIRYPHDVGSYCIRLALSKSQLNSKTNYEGLYFSGKYPEKLYIKEEMPAIEIIQKYVLEMFNLVKDKILGEKLSNEIITLFNEYLVKTDFSAKLIQSL